MRAAVILCAFAGLTLVSQAAAGAASCADGWTLFSNDDGSELGKSCFQRFATKLTPSGATGACTKWGKSQSPAVKTRLLTFRSKANDGSTILDKALEGAPEGSFYWVGGSVSKKDKTNPDLSTWKWSDGTSAANLNVYANGECSGEGDSECGPWGLSPFVASDGVNPPIDAVAYPSGCANEFSAKLSSKCTQLAGNVGASGLVDRPSSLALGYICQYSATDDEDDDQVPDASDFCPGTQSLTGTAFRCSGSGIARKCVDKNGCNALQLDVDGDKFCTSPSPMITIEGKTPVATTLCKGADTCNNAYNPLQSTTACESPVSSLCHPACAFGCERTKASKVDSLKVCTTPVFAATGLQRNAERCTEGYTPMGSNIYARGCAVAA